MRRVGRKRGMPVVAAHAALGRRPFPFGAAHVKNIFFAFFMPIFLGKCCSPKKFNPFRTFVIVHLVEPSCFYLSSFRSHFAHAKKRRGDGEQVL